MVGAGAAARALRARRCPRNSQRRAARDEAGGGRLRCGSGAGSGSLRRDQGDWQRHHRRFPALSLADEMDQELPPIRSTGIGSWPGTDMADAIKIAFAECPDLPYLPELPARGPYAELIGRFIVILPGLPVATQFPYTPQFRS